MTLDIRGSIKNTKLSSNPFVVFEELISNAIDSFLIRRHSDTSVKDLTVAIEVTFQKSDLLGDRETFAISCRDNGCGLGDPQLNAFLTKDTSYKDDLPISGIGQCKGAGRIQFFHHFSELGIDSTYREKDEVFERRLRYAEPKKQIDSKDFERRSGDVSQIGTDFRLSGFKEAVRARFQLGDTLSETFSAHALKRTMLIAC